MKKILPILLILSVTALHQIAKAQAVTVVYTLQNCIETALTNNIDVKQAELLAETARLNYNRSRAGMLPELNAGISHSAYNGRSINPYTNDYINESNNAANYQLSGNLILWNGSSLHNYMKQSRLNYEAGKMDARNAADKITLDIILNYLYVLSNQEQLNMALSQVEASRRKVELLELKNEQGAVSPSDLYDMKGQLASDELQLVSTRKSLESAKLTLCQLMNIPFQSDMQLAPLDEISQILPYASTPGDVYTNAVSRLPLVKAMDLKVEAASRTIKAVRGQYFPTLYLSGGLYTNYSSTARTQELLGVSDAETSDYVWLNNNKLPVYSPQYNYNSVPITYGTQLGNNFNSAVSLGLQIPILNGFQVRNKLNQAKVAEKQVMTESEETRILLRQSIDQDFVNMNADYESYQILKKQEENYKLSFEAADIRYNNGAISTVDYIIAKNNLDHVSISLVAMKYNYILRTKLLDFYQSKALW